MQSQYTRASTEVGHSGEGTCVRGGNSATRENASAEKQLPRNSHVSVQEDPNEVLLPTTMLKVRAVNGSFCILRALLDQGSQTSIITEHAAKALKIPRQRCKGIISGVGDKESNSKGMVTLQCSSLINDFSFETDALIMKQLIKNLPSCTLQKSNWSYLDHITLADPEFYKSRPVDILLGADIYSIVIMDGICRVNSALPTAQQTQLGWILSGNTKTVHCNVVLHNIEAIQKFWEIEDLAEKSDLSLEDKRCMEFYQSTTKRRDDGRYEVRLPLKPEYQEKLGNSKSKAIAQFNNLERKLQLNKSIKNDYLQFIQEYLSLGHMTPAAVDRNAFLRCYLPHHCVTRNDSTTTKLRVVFNASSKTSSGLSLNDVMLRGPNLQQDLMNLILKWRQFKYAFTADIEKMFRQIRISNKDQNLQMILWRDNPNKKLLEYHLATISYGTKAAPFLAMMTLKRLAHDERPNFQDSLAPSVLEESFYMDDLIHGAHSIQAAKQLQTDMTNLLKTGGFHLRKWKSNSPKLLKHVNVPGQEQDPFDFKQVESTKRDPQTDNFTFQSQLLTSSKLTKRTLLSEISKIFDPLGWLSPLTTKLKILFQDVWFQCKTIFSTCKNRWLELRSLNKYFFFCCEPCHMKLVCDDQITHLQLTNSGFFSVFPSLFSGIFSVSHRQRESKLNIFSNIPSFKMSQINNVINISLPSVSINDTSDLSRNYTVQLQDIRRNIVLMKNTEPLAEMSFHDVHHYAAIYILFALVGLGGAVWVYNCSRRRAQWAPERGPRAAPAREAPQPTQSTVQPVQCSEVINVSDISASVLVKETPRFSVPDGYLNTSPV